MKASKYVLTTVTLKTHASKLLLLSVTSCWDRNEADRRAIILFVKAYHAQGFPEEKYTKVCPNSHTHLIAISDCIIKKFYNTKW